MSFNSCSLLCGIPSCLIGTGFILETDVLYWQADVGGLTYAIEEESKAKNPEFEWDFGFKLGLGYALAHDDWELLLRFTSLQTHTDAHHDGAVFLPTWQLENGIPSFVDDVTMHWRLHLGLLDTVLIRRLELARTLGVDVEFGARVGWIRQKFNLEYRPDPAEWIHTKNKFWGIGPYLNLGAEWRFAKRWNFFGRVGVSALAGEIYLHQAEATFDKEEILGIHNTFWLVLPTLEGDMGVSWQTCHVRVALAWNQAVFFSQNQLMHLKNTGTFFSNQGDVGIHGVQLGATFYF
ncbi:MAG: hypothetical protein JSS61_04430 [Verrucomicrobia bacterium]|nr:hypothetical protein [Verrucomicrobiota bacterium]